MTWVLSLRDTDDPYGFTAHATQRDEVFWDVTYSRDGAVVSGGSISTPPPHRPPVATLEVTLEQLRREADYWSKRVEP